jgi:hypothetical protein
MLRNPYATGLCMILGTAALIYSGSAKAEESAKAEDDARALRGFMCETPKGVESLIQRMNAVADDEPLMQFAAEIPDEMKCTYTVKMARFVDTSSTTIESKPYNILHFKDADGKDIFSWERLPGDPA